MSQSSSTSNIVKPLEWEISCNDPTMRRPLYCLYAIGEHEIEYIIDRRRNKDKSLYIDIQIYYQSEGGIVSGGFPTLDAAKEACQNHYNDFMRPFLIKPEPFWKPIEQCPKELGKQYVCFHKKWRLPVVVTSLAYAWEDETNRHYLRESNIYLDGDFTHYAEIPALPDTEESQP